jgi:CBS domain-containing protein
MLKQLDLGHFMLRHPVSIDPDANLLDAMHLILANKVSGLCVVDEGRRLVGVLSELDCLRGVLDATYNATAIGRVRDVMTSGNLVVARVGDDIVDVAQAMLGDRHRRRPVVDEEGRLVGQITARQILRAVKEFSAPTPAGERD